jgi:hypothetical protein
LSVSLLLGAALSACGVEIFSNVAEDPEGCDPKPLGANSGWSLGVQKVAALCAALVEVEGRTYSVGAGGWLAEDALLLTEYGAISATNTPFKDPTVYSLEGIDPLRLVLAYRDRPAEGSEDLSTFVTLWGEPFEMPENICRYVDPGAPGAPGTCSE